MKRRAVLLVGCAILAVASPRAYAQGLPLGGFDLSDWSNVATAAARNQTENVKSLLAAGKTPDVTDGDGQTPLGYAASFGNTEMAAILLKYNAPVDRRDQFGNAPLHWASQRGSIDIMQLLLDAKATVDAQNRQGITPLMMAASRGQAAAVRLLLKHGADPQKQDYTGRDATGWAEGKTNVLQALRVAKAS
jgi:ankyrin repeat protein